MFSHFQSQPHSIPKRRKVTRACNFCRANHQRCDPTTPCAPCVHNNINCSRGGDTIIELDHNVDRQSSSGQLPQDVPVGSPVIPPNPALQRMDSMLGFILRINSFCSGVLQLRETSSSSPNEPRPPSRSPFCLYMRQEPSVTACDLSTSQIDRLLHIFWKRLWPQIPIVGPEHLNPENSSICSSALRDAIVAYSMQYVYYSRLYLRLLGLQWPEFSRTSSESMVGLAHFQRALAATTQFGAFAAPSLGHIQCYCFLALYLLDAGQHQTAYNVIGMAIQFAQSIDLVSEPWSGPQSEEARLRRRVWWTLIHLDFRCCRHIGRAVNRGRLPDMCAPPTPEDIPLGEPGSVCYHTASLRLTATVLAIINSTGQYSLQNTAVTPNTDIEYQAERLTAELGRLMQWRSEVTFIPGLELDVPDMPPDKDAADEEDYFREPPMQLLLRTLLQLQYHEVMITLHRVFVEFPSHSLVPKSSPLAGAHAATALNHALTTIRKAHNLMMHHDILHGYCELYQDQWNAVLTLIGFMLAYPYCHHFQKAREHLHLALEIFDGAGCQNVAAARAASLTRHLCNKVDTLVKILDINEAQRQAMYASDRQAFSSRCNTVAHPAAASGGDAGRARTSQNDPSIIAQQRDSDRSSLTWLDFINMDAWPTYCDEVSGAFLDLPEMGI